MSRPLKFRYVNEIVGVFVLLVAAGLVAAIVLAGRAQGWFEPTYEVTTVFPDEGAFGLQEGSPVVILGTRAGSIHRIETLEDGGLQGVLAVRGRFTQFIRQDSVALVKQTLGVGGDAFIEITRGRGEALDPGVPEIQCRREEDLFEALKTQAEEIKGAIMPTIEQLRVALESYALLADELRDPDGPLFGFLARMNELAEGLEQGKGSAGHFLKDPALAESMTRISQDLEVSLERINDILDNTRTASASLPALTGQAGAQLEALPALTDQAREGLEEAEQLLQALQRHWLIRRYVEPREAMPDWLPPPAVEDRLEEGP